MSAKKGGSGKKRPVSGKKAGKKEETEDPTITQFRAINEDLLKQNAALRESVNNYHNKLQTIIQQILQVSTDNYSPAKGVAEVDIPEADILRMITNLTIAPSNILHDYEVRLQHQEARLTQLSTELSKLLKLKLNVENNLNQIKKMCTLEDVKVHAKLLWYDCCTTRVYARQVETNQNIPANGFIQSELSEMSCRPTSLVGQQGRHGDLMQEPIPALYLNVLSPRAQSINLAPAPADMEDVDPPEKKMPGETHIFNMHVALRSLIIRELSKQKGNANDWRLMATRVGIPDNLLEQWIKMRAPNAMALVMKVWGDSTGATVRMLHRHLVSPQMKALVLAKRISDFYDVD